MLDQKKKKKQQPAVEINTALPAAGLVCGGHSQGSMNCKVENSCRGRVSVSSGKKERKRVLLEAGSSLANTESTMMMAERPT